jgi:hypothetical protein
VAAARGGTWAEHTRQRAQPVVHEFAGTCLAYGSRLLQFFCQKNYLADKKFFSFGTPLDKSGIYMTLQLDNNII